MDMEGSKGRQKWYWQQRPRQRPDGSISGPRRRHNKAELGNGRQCFWQFCITPRLRFLRRLPSPKQIMTAICNAYVRMMLSLAGSGAFAGGYEYFGDAEAAIGRPKLEYDEKAVVEIYKTVMAKSK